MTELPELPRGGGLLAGGWRGTRYAPFLQWVLAMDRARDVTARSPHRRGQRDAEQARPGSPALGPAGIAVRRPERRLCRRLSADFRLRTPGQIGVRPDQAEHG